MEAYQQKDLQTARDGASFKSAHLTPIIWPEKRRAEIDDLVSIMSREPVFNKDTRRHLSRQELLNHGYAIQLRLIQLRQEHGWDEDTFSQAMGLIDDHVPFGLHFNAFMPVVRSQGSDEQIAKWLPRCLDLEVIGCYAQTELGHGSNVQALETTATFDVQDGAFVINSPTLTSAKWWVGGMGTVANHAVVQAQLILKGTNLGPHLFIVPLRDQKSHRTFTGIQIGDIGPKHYGGFNMNDNGFARFDNVRIPLENFLCRYAKVDKLGNYKPAGHAKIGYGSMVALRAGMPIVLGLELGKCVTIALRYTTVRRQFSVAPPKVTDKLEDGASETGAIKPQNEMQVIKYSSVKERLVPLLAASYCYVLTGHSTMALYRKMLSALVNPPHDASLLAEVHLLTSGLKAVLSWNVVAGMEESRKALGGHGFSIYSGIGERFAKEVPGQTYEGDNYVLVQQTAKGLLKNMGLLLKGKLDQMMESTRFLATLPRSGLGEDIDLTQQDKLLTILGLRVGALLKDLAERVASEQWSELNMDCVRLTRAFIDHYTASNFYSEIRRQSNLDDRSKNVLLKLANVFTLDALKTSIADLAEFGIISPTSIKKIRKASSAAINSLTPDLIALSDAFAFTDFELNSVLGQKDGNVYESLWKTVNERNPINTNRIDGVVKGYEQLLKPLNETARGSGGGTRSRL